MTRLEPIAARLPLLLEELRGAGYAIGLEQDEAAHELLIALAARGAVPVDPKRLVSMLGPVLCTSPREQEDFPVHFDRWLGVIGLRADADVLPDRPFDHIPATRRRRWPSWPIIAALVLAVATAGIASLRLLTGPAGVWGFVKHSWKDSFEELGSEEEGKSLEPSWWQQARVAPAPAAQPVPTASSHFKLVWWLGGLALFFAAVVGWQVWWSVRARMFLKRRITHADPEFRSVPIKGFSARMFRNLTLAQAAHGLRRRESTGTKALEVRASVDQAVRRAGWFAPVWGRLRVTPEYLVLIDRASFDDHQARLFDHLIDGLVEHEVAVSRYYFDRDPRACNVAAPGTPPLSLRELAARHHGSRLVLLTDGAGLFDPITGEEASWSDLLDAWSERALLTPEAVDRQGPRERVLARGGWLVLPATERGLVELASLLTKDSLAPPAPVPSPQLPEGLQSQSFRWLERYSPASDDVEHLVEGLRRYLGPEGFEWLAACAVFPTMRWETTVYLGHHLKESNGQRLLTPGRLGAIARLPWFRHGWMPDWLRLRLIREMPRRLEQAARAVFNDLLYRGHGSPGDAGRLEVAGGPTALSERLGMHAFFALLNRLGRQGTLSEHVFAQFMCGRRPDPLAFLLPRALTIPLIRRGPRYAARLPRRRSSPVRYLGDFVMTLALPASRPIVLLLALALASVLALAAQRRAEIAPVSPQVYPAGARLAGSEGAAPAQAPVQMPSPPSDVPRDLVTTKTLTNEPKLMAHVIVAVDTTGTAWPDLRPAFVRDRDRLLDLFRGNVAPGRLNLEIISDDRLTSNNLLGRIDQMTVRDADTIVFWYVGPGGYDRQHGNAFLTLAAGREHLLQSELLQRIRAKRPRQIVVFTDICSSEPVRLAGFPGGRSPGAIAGNARKTTPLFETLLFGHYGLTVLSTKPASIPYAFEGGTFFTWALTEELSRSPEVPRTWSLIVQNLKDSTDSFALRHSSPLKLSPLVYPRAVDLSPLVSSISRGPAFGVRGRVDDEGVSVVEVVQGTPASRAGIEVGDRIIAINGHPIRSEEEYSEAIDRSPPAMKLEIVNVRTGRRETRDVPLDTGG